jgi:hypothetical protein
MNKNLLICYFSTFFLAIGCASVIVISLRQQNLQVQAETLVIEKNKVANGIVELIHQHHITKLVMGTSTFSMYVDIEKIIYTLPPFLY